MLTRSQKYKLICDFKISLLTLRFYFALQCVFALSELTFLILMVVSDFRSVFHPHSYAVITVCYEEFKYFYIVGRKGTLL